jgi:hypothetical protein
VRGHPGAGETDSMHVHRSLPTAAYGRLRVERHDLTPARWLERPPPGDGGSGTVAGVCAPGFEAYARILHPARHGTARLGEAPVRWDRVAAGYGRTVSAGTVWHEVIGAKDPYLYRNDDVPAVPGVWDEHPEDGPTPADVARTLIPVLARHTSPPTAAGTASGTATAATTGTASPSSTPPSATRSCSTTPTRPPVAPTRRRTNSPTCGGRRTAPGAWAATSTW